MNSVRGAHTLIASYLSLTICVHMIFYLLVFKYLRIVVLFMSVQWQWLPKTNCKSTVTEQKQTVSAITESAITVCFCSDLTFM